MLGLIILPLLATALVWDVFSTDDTEETEDDKITGTDARDFLELGDSSDDLNIDSGLGFDVLRSGSGNDSIVSGDGGDIIHAGDGNDTIEAGDGPDLVYSGNGDDLIDLSEGDDRWYDLNDDSYTLSQQGADLTETGNDTVYGGAGNDAMYSDGGADSLFGEDGNDTLIGENSSSTILYTIQRPEDGWVADGPAAYLNGGDGNDVLAGNDGDTLVGGEGRDMFWAIVGGIATPDEIVVLDDPVIIEDFDPDEDSLIVLSNDSDLPDSVLAEDPETGDAVYMIDDRIVVRLVGVSAAEMA